MVQTIEITTAANITYDGMTYNTPLFVEYQHTGVEYYIKNKYTTDIQIANEWKAKGKKVIEKTGHYFIKRIAIPNVTDEGKKDKWYINNEGDNYTVNKVSKYWQKRHLELCKNAIIKN